MTDTRTDNLNVARIDPMASPDEIKARIPLSEKAAATVLAGRTALQNVLNRTDPRLMVVVGPCSIHDPVAGLDYAHRLKKLADALSDTLLIVMRVYFEKPRTSTGWKGYINDPDMDDSFHINEGMEKARRFLLRVNELGLPAATEALDPIAPQYYGDLISWTAIGARTSESQTHREMASGLSTPVGFKNATDGTLDAAVNGILSAAAPHSFLGLNGQGQSAIFRTKGNAYAHTVLRGGGGRPNYDTVSVSLAEKALTKAKLPANIMVDCSHANSWKNHDYQPLVFKDVAHQIREGNTSIIGVMIESFIEAGNQPIPADLDQLRYGCSVTDACISWDTTEALLRDTAACCVRHSKPGQRPKPMRLELVGESAHRLAHVLAPLTDAVCVETLSPRHVRVRGLRQALEAARAQCLAADIDFALLPDAARLSDYRLFITDMDSTLINIECIDELADLAGRKAEVARITEAAMQGSLDFDAALRERVALLAGLPEAALETVWQTRLALNPGAAAWLAHIRALGMKTLLVSGGFTYFTERLKAQLGFDEAYANQLEIQDGQLTGQLTGEIINAAAKAEKLHAACARYSIAPEHTLAAGDGANDLLMAQQAGLAIAYHAKPVLRAHAACTLMHEGFEVLMPMLG